jgi:hypothetical protein
MSSIKEEWENMRMIYQQRYVKYLKEYNETESEYARGHLNECSYALIGIFGLTNKQMRELEQNYSGLTSEDLKD